MESLVNYESDDESGEFIEGSKNECNNAVKIEEDVNYDDIGMDESSEESNNNHTEGHLTFLSREKESSLSRNFRNSKDYDSNDSCGNSNFEFESKLSKKQNKVDCNLLCQNNRQRDFFEENQPEFHLQIQESRQTSIENSPLNKNVQPKEECEHRNDEAATFNFEGKSKKIDLELADDNHASKAKGNEELIRRHSSDMEMDDGEDDLQNYKDSKDVDTAAEYRQKYTQKSINFSKSKDINSADNDQKRTVSPYRSTGYKIKQNDSKSLSKNHRSAENENNLNIEENQKTKEDRLRQKDKEKNAEDRRRDDYKKKEERDRKKEDDRWRESDRDRRRDNDKYRDDRERDRKRSPDRHGRKRSHSPDRRDRDRDRDRARDRDKDRDRDYRSSDRRSPKRSRSPDRSWKARKLEKKAAVLNKLGIEIKADASGSMTPRQLLGEQLKAQILEVEAKTGITLPTYYNPGVMNPLKYAQQIQKRKLLWGNKNNEAKNNESAGQGTSVPSNVKQWEAATFKGDSDGKMTEKFKRLMGIKGDNSVGNTITKGAKPPETKELIQKQEEMFSNMEAQYQVARMATHTHRGVGLGFGTFQVPPR